MDYKLNIDIKIYNIYNKTDRLVCGGFFMEQKRKSNDTRQKIIEVAAKLFLKKGFDKTTMRDIVENLNMSKGAIYHHFKSKGDIIDAVYKIQDEQISNQILSLQNDLKEMNGKEKISAVIKDSVCNQENLNHNEDVSNFMKSAEYILKYMKDNVSKNAPVIAEMIEEGNKDGSLSCEYPQEMAEVFLLLFNIWCDPAIFEEDKEKLYGKLKFIQSMMKTCGIDVIEDEIIKKLCDEL